MISFAFHVFIIATASATLWCQKNNDDIKILHVVFRHGDRTPLFGYPKDPYKNVTLPRGPGELTLNGRNKAYKLGQLLGCRYQKLLRNRPYYEILKATSSEYNRTRETLLSVLAGMFPPRPKERLSPCLYWQPIPYDYLKFSEDNMLAVQSGCNQVMQINSSLDLDPKTKRIFRVIEENTGIKIPNYFMTIGLKDYLEVMNELGYAIPKWAQPYWPQPFKTFSNRGWHQLFDHYLDTIVGNLLHKIAEDSSQPLAKTDKRVYLYSGHDTNMGALLDALGAFAHGHINYAAFMAFEVVEVAGKRRVLVYFDNRDEMGTYLEIPGCGFDCPIEDFLKFAEKFYLGDQWCT